MRHAYHGLGPHSVVSASGAGTFAVSAERTDATHATVRVQGEMDLATADLLAAVLDNELAVGCLIVQLDLSRLTFLDCSGLSVLVHAHNAFLAVPGGTLVLTGVGARVARLLQITHLDEALFVARACSGTG